MPLVFLIGLNAATLSYQLPKYPNVLTAPGMDAIALINLAVGLGLALMRKLLLQPWKRLLESLELAQQELQTDTKQPPQSMGGVAAEVARLTQVARESYAQYQHATRELNKARSAVEQCKAVQQAIIDSASREMTCQYQSVLGYAHYLEEQITARQNDSALREDFDDVAESSLNLKLIASALELFNRPVQLTHVNVATIMQQMMLALVPSLERRTMRLSSAEVDTTLAAHTDASILTHVLWMIHLGIVRYAESESTLRLRCIQDHTNQNILVSLVVSELSPGTLSPQERGEYLKRQLEALNPHMFAETIRIHANIQLVEMLLGTVGGRVEVSPLNAHACEVCVTLPAAKNTANS